MRRRIKLVEIRLVSMFVGNRSPSSGASLVILVVSRELLAVETLGTCKVWRCCNRIATGCREDVDEAAGVAGVTAEAAEFTKLAGDENLLLLNGNE